MFIRCDEGGISSVGAGEKSSFGDVSNAAAPECCLVVVMCLCKGM